ncbi:MAG: LmbE family protein [Stygiobacter sp.]|nr:MAG: LmbE family protein [Stygiobacter sp.]KAF0217236.1 MAG: LmbE family [Ignavibacteria bacterium]
MIKKTLLIFALLASVGTYYAQEKILVIAPHPDDAESSCGGLIANHVAIGDEVIILTMTGGEYGISGKSADVARSTRTKEAVNATKVLGAKAEFFGAIDAFLTVDSANTAKLKKFINDLKPTIVFSVWPLDVHSDHQATGILTWRVFLESSSSFDLYFYETCNPTHTKSFQFVPTDYVDITNVCEKKKEATLQHKSQSPQEWYGMYETLALTRGYESDVQYAEGFIKAQNFSGMGGRSSVVPKTLKKRK